jgi:hypothetical protein
MDRAAWSPHGRRVVRAICFVVAASCAASCFAAELTTDAERTYHQLRAAKDARTQLMGDRWYNLIRSQEWKSLDGKFVTTAKYVEHDPDLAWVKLRVIKGTGADRVVKDVTVPVAKLSKTCQSRVRQISVLTDKVAEAAVEAEAAKKADEEGREGELPREDAAGEMRGDEELGMGDMEAQGPPGRDGPRSSIDGPPLEEPPADTRPADAPPADTAGSTTVERAPLPPRIPSLPSSDVSASPAATTDATAAAAPAQGDGPPVVQAAATSTPDATAPAEGDRPPTPRGAVAEQPAPQGGTPQGEVPPAIMPDNAPWRTDYEAFRANITLDTSQRMPRTNWGELTALQEACDTVTKWEATGDVGDEAIEEIATKFAAVGEFEWEATLVDGDPSSGDWTERFNFPPVNDLIEIGFMLDTKNPTGNWQSLKSGDRVRFIGRFMDFESGGDLIVAIRFPENAVIGGTAGGERQ